MSMRSFFGMLRLKFFRLLFGRDLFTRLIKPDPFGCYADLTTKIQEAKIVIESQYSHYTDLATRIQELKIAVESQYGYYTDLTTQVQELRTKMEEKVNRLDYIKHQADMSVYLLNKTQTFLLLKEQSPELLREFVAGLRNDSDLIKALAGTNIFRDLQDDFNRNINIFMQKFQCGAPNLELNTLYENYINLAKNPLYRHQVFNSILAVFMPQYKNDEIAQELDRLYDKLSIINDKWGVARYVLWLLLREEEKKALNILKDYLKYNEFDTIQEHIPISDLMHRNGITNDIIASASQLFQTIVKNVDDRMLESYIESFGKDATIAIVGNGPHEIGLGKGEEIDMHDIVIRFNNYNTDEKYMKDYGKKTNIVFFTPSGGADCDHKDFFMVLDRPVDMFVTHSLYAEQVAVEMIQKYKEKPFSNITTIESSGVRREIQQKYCINWPTTGFRCVYYFKEILGKKIKKSDIYGFALNHGTILEGHYDNISFSTDNGFHDLNMEFAAMKDLFKE